MAHLPRCTERRSVQGLRAPIVRDGLVRITVSVVLCGAHVRPGAGLRVPGPLCSHFFKIKDKKKRATKGPVAMLLFAALLVLYSPTKPMIMILHFFLWVGPFFKKQSSYSKNTIDQVKIQCYSRKKYHRIRYFKSSRVLQSANYFFRFMPLRLSLSR